MKYLFHFLLSFQLVSSVPTTGREKEPEIKGFIARKDRIGGAFGSEFYTSIVESLPPSIAKTPALKFASTKAASASGDATATSSFQFNFNCDGTSQQLCDWAKTGFVSAGNRISQVLLISNPIIVDAKFHSFCQAQGGGSCKQVNNTLGRASAAAYFSAGDVNNGNGGQSASKTTYYYPQPLVKQLHTSESLNYASIDIYAEFNSDFNFYFKASGQPIGANQTDFEFVVSHELTHGLGFDSAWVQYSSYYSSFSPPSDILAPLPFAQGDTYASATISSMSPLNIFDSLLQLPNSSTSMAAKYGSVISNYKVSGLSLADFIGDLSTDSSLNGAAKSAMSAAKSGLQLKSLVAPSSPPLIMNTPANFAQGTSIVHVTPKSATTADFLMIPAMSPLLGKSLDSILASVNSSLIYGPGISGALAGMGWPTKDFPVVKNLQMVRVSGAASASIAGSAVLIAFITTAFLS